MVTPRNSAASFIVRKSLKFSMEVYKTLYNIIIPLSIDFMVPWAHTHSDLRSLDSTRNLETQIGGTSTGFPNPRSRGRA